VHVIAVEGLFDSELASGLSKIKETDYDEGGHDFEEKQWMEEEVTGYWLNRRACRGGQ